MNSHVNAKVSRLREALVANAALPRLKATVNSAVVTHQLRPQRKSLRAHGADVRLFARVHAHVLQQLTRLVVRLRAIGALVWKNARVQAGVQAQVDGALEGETTHGAQVRSGVRVRSLVVAACARLRESTVASSSAHVRQQICVCVQVNSQSDPRLVSLAALVATVHPVTGARLNCRRVRILSIIVHRRFVGSESLRFQEYGAALSTDMDRSHFAQVLVAVHFLHVREHNRFVHKPLVAELTLVAVVAVVMFVVRHLVCGKSCRRAERTRTTRAPKHSTLSFLRRLVVRFVARKHEPTVERSLASRTRICGFRIARLRRFAGIELSMDLFVSFPRTQAAEGLRATVAVEHLVAMLVVISEVSLQLQSGVERPRTLVALKNVRRFFLLDRRRRLHFAYVHRLTSITRSISISIVVVHCLIFISGTAPKLAQAFAIVNCLDVPIQKRLVEKPLVAKVTVDSLVVVGLVCVRHFVLVEHGTARKRARAA